MGGRCSLGCSSHIISVWLREFDMSATCLTSAHALGCGEITVHHVSPHRPGGGSPDGDKLSEGQCHQVVAKPNDSIEGRTSTRQVQQNPRKTKCVREGKRGVICRTVRFAIRCAIFRALVGASVGKIDDIRPNLSERNHWEVSATSINCIPRAANSVRGSIKLCLETPPRKTLLLLGK